MTYGVTSAQQDKRWKMLQLLDVVPTKFFSKLQKLENILS